MPMISGMGMIHQQNRDQTTIKPTFLLLLISRMAMPMTQMGMVVVGMFNQHRSFILQMMYMRQKIVEH